MSLFCCLGGKRVGRFEGGGGPTGLMALSTKLHSHHWPLSDHQRPRVVAVCLMPIDEADEGGWQDNEMQDHEVIADAGYYMIFAFHCFAFPSSADVK